MEYRLGDICTITKGETGIMKAIPGSYTMVALGEANKTHNEFQFDTKAVIVPLVSSTGHGHASMKRVKYQEGKFALGSILCAVIPKDEKVILAKYLHIYLHWNREELLVAQMKGMANVSLPMNKIADVVVIVPSIEKQKEIIDLEKKLVERELKADKLFADQITQLENLNQAILQEAVQGKLVKQDPKDEPASELLKRIKYEKANSGKKEKPLPPIKPEEIPFEIPENWLWCSLGEIFEIENGDRSSNYPIESDFKSDGVGFFNTKNLIDGKMSFNSVNYISQEKFESLRSGKLKDRDLLVVLRGSVGKSGIFIADEKHYTGFINAQLVILRCMNIFSQFYLYFLQTNIFLKQSVHKTTGSAQPQISAKNLQDCLIPLPPLSEQKRIVAEIEKQLAKTKQLKEHIIANKQATEQLLKALLHQAFKVEEMEEV